MADEKDPVILKYTPVRDGDYVAGVPREDIRQSRYQRLEPVQLHAMTVPGASGKPLYSYVDKSLARSQDRAGKQAATDAGKDGEA